MNDPEETILRARDVCELPTYSSVTYVQVLVHFQVGGAVSADLKLQRPWRARVFSCDLLSEGLLQRAEAQYTLLREESVGFSVRSDIFFASPGIRSGRGGTSGIPTSLSL